VYKSIDNESQSTAPFSGGEVIVNTKELAPDTLILQVLATHSEDGRYDDK
jgi:hypothetical protein